MLKKLLSLIFAVLVMLSLASCGNNNAGKDDSWKNKNSNELTEKEKEKASDYVNKMFEGSKSF